MNSMGLKYPRVEWSHRRLYHHTYLFKSERSRSTLVYVLAYMSSIPTCRVYSMASAENELVVRNIMRCALR